MISASDSSFITNVVVQTENLRVDRATLRKNVRESTICLERFTDCLRAINNARFDGKNFVKIQVFRDSSFDSKETRSFGNRMCDALCDTLRKLGYEAHTACQGLMWQLFQEVWDTPLYRHYIEIKW